MEKNSEFKDLIGSSVDALAPRERVLRAALILFNREGVHMTGVDRIIAESGVAKMTFYKHFPSKTKLIAEYLGYQDQVWFSLIKKFTSDPASSTLDRLLGIFDALEFLFRSPEFHGCPFIRGLSDFGEPIDAPEIRERLSYHFRTTEAVVTELAKQAEPKGFERLVPQLMILINGSIIAAHASRDPLVVRTSKKAARTLIQQMAVEGKN